MHLPRPRALMSTAIGIAALLAAAQPAAQPVAQPAASGTVPAVDTASVGAYLAAHPGGEIVNDNEISYDGGAFVVTLRRPVRAGIGTVITGADCPYNWYCFYDRTYFGYPRGKLSACGRQSLDKWGWQDRIESVHYNMPYGYATYYDGSYALYMVGAGFPTIGNVSPYNNLATHVHRFC